MPTKINIPASARKQLRSIWNSSKRKTPYHDLVKDFRSAVRRGSAIERRQVQVLTSSAQ